MESAPNQSQYTVVARRYRPQSFGDMVGQNHIAHALSNAIKQSRVGHAYLFTGARGVGKTSSARIFAKCLNCENGPAPQPCNECDLCTSVSAGDDIDVLEIDGASNRGIEEIRQLRSNAIVRPSRARYKIYIIDEVHMLTQPAFNALLKTLEEPPAHVKFIFCTTDPQKIPITVLSRCQRFDFSPVQTPDIMQRLREICENENVTADEQALAVLARRAAGSMRDSQSLLEQLLSFCSDNISVQDVHQLLGTADISRIAAIADAAIEKNPAGCIDLVTAAINDGVDAGQLSNQLLGYFRDVMAMQVGASSESLQTCDESDVPSLQEKGKALGLQTILSIVQVLDQTVTRMQSSLHGRTLLEVAMVRICDLSNLNLLADLIDQIGAGGAPSSRPPAKKKLNKAEQTSRPEPQPPSQPNPPAPQPPIESKLPTPNVTAAVAAPVAASPPPPATGASSPQQPQALTDANVVEKWLQAASKLGDVTSDMASQYKAISLKGNLVTVSFGQKHICEYCRRADRATGLKEALSQIAGSEIGIQFDYDEQPQIHAEVKQPKMSRVQIRRQLEQNDLVKSAMEVFEAEVVEFRDMRKKP